MEPCLERLHSLTHTRMFWPTEHVESLLSLWYYNKALLSLFVHTRYTDPHQKQNMQHRPVFFLEG